MAVTDVEIEEALYKSCGVVAQAARMLGIARKSLHVRIQKSEELRKSLESFRESNIDMAENLVFKRLRWADNMAKVDEETNEVKTPPSTDDVKLAINFLKMKGKDRGYVERTETTGKGGVPLHPVDTEDMSDEDLMAIIKGRKP